MWVWGIVLMKDEGTWFKHDAFVFLFQGEGVIEFFNSMSTRNLHSSGTTIFLTPQGKIIDVVEIIFLEQGYALVGSIAHKNQFLSFLEKSMLNVTFTVTDITHLNHVYISLNNPNQPMMDGINHSSFLGNMFIVSSQKPQPQACDVSTWNEYRIERKLPYYQHEITPEQHPFACGLGHLIQPNKGCYPGQEIMTRMMTRQSFGRHLVHGKNPLQHATTIGQTHSLAIQRIRQ